MSVLIQGMQVPTRCAECWLMDGEDSWCTACRGRHLYPEYRSGIKDSPEGCPLVPVPPHGRLIDADALHYSRIRIAHPSGDIGGWNAVVMSAEINNAPTIIPPEEE